MLDELAGALDTMTAEYPEICRLRRIGTSRLGEPLRMLSAGHGDRNTLVIGCPHPNEPIGLLTVLELARLVIRHPELGTGYTWNFVPCLDPDGTRMNEGWFDGPFTVRHHHENCYRPAMSDQPEWTFPVLDERAYFDRSLPETQALARVIDELRPVFQYSLHNADFGGVLFILTRSVPGAADLLADMARKQGVPLSLGQTDTLGWPTDGAGLYLLPSAEDLISAAGPAGPRHGGSSAHHAERYGTVTLVTEVPFWHDRRASDGSDSGRRYADVLAAAANRLRGLNATLTELRERIEPELRVPTPMRPAIEDHLAILAALANADEAMAATMEERQASVAEVFAADRMVHLVALRTAGLLRRQLIAETVAGNQPPGLRAAGQEIDGLFDDWCEAAERELVAELFPLRSLVTTQIGAALALSDRV